MTLLNRDETFDRIAGSSTVMAVFTRDANGQSHQGKYDVIPADTVHGQHRIEFDRSLIAVFAENAGPGTVHHALSQHKERAA